MVAGCLSSDLILIEVYIAICLYSGVISIPFCAIRMVMVALGATRVRAGIEFLSVVVRVHIACGVILPAGGRTEWIGLCSVNGWFMLCRQSSQF